MQETPEIRTPSKIIKSVSSIISENVNLDSIMQTAKKFSSKQSDIPKFSESSGNPLVRIAIARDKAFGFYYPNDLNMLEREGAEIHYFDALNDPILPTVDGLFIGGGFPETNASKLAENKSLRNNIKLALVNGLPTYAECGGLIYLSKNLIWKNKTYEMVGFIPGNTVIRNRPVGRGYVMLSETHAHPWPDRVPIDTLVPAHEFHHASLENLPINTKFAYNVVRGHGINGTHDGIVMNNVVAGFTHRFSSNRFNWARRFVNFVRQHKLR